MNGYKVDEEQPRPRYKSKDGNLPSIKASLGWSFPEVKLASWDPENEKQWKVRSSATTSSSTTGFFCFYFFCLLGWYFVVR